MSSSSESDGNGSGSGGGSPGASALRSFFLGGFECSSHRRRDGVRLDLLHATRHVEFADADYARLASRGIHAARDGIAWHLAEPSPGRYDWSNAVPILRAARSRGVQVAWDLCHYGWPDGLDVFSSEWVRRFVRFARAFAALVRDECDDPPFYTPVNEISFFAWAAGDVSYLNPHAHARGHELKRQLVRATIEAIDAIRDVDPRARFLIVDPLVHVHPRSDALSDLADAEACRLAQFEAVEMLTGVRAPELRGTPRNVDVVGVNYYPHNQWLHGTPRDTIWRADPRYRPLREMLIELYDRVRRPIIIAETGAEGAERAPWLAYVCAEARAAMTRGVPVVGVCLYPIVSYPGWDDCRHCHNGLWDYADDDGSRPICDELSAELERQQRFFARHARAAEPERFGLSASAG